MGWENFFGAEKAEFYQEFNDEMAEEQPLRLQPVVPKKPVEVYTGKERVFNSPREGYAALQISEENIVEDNDNTDNMNVNIIDDEEAEIFDEEEVEDIIQDAD